MYNEINSILGTSYTSDEDIDWKDVSSLYPLTEEFIRTYKDNVHWRTILRYQKLSVPFLTENIDKLRPYGYELSTYQRLTPEFIAANKSFLKKIMWTRNQPRQTYDDVIFMLDNIDGGHFEYLAGMAIPTEAAEYMLAKDSGEWLTICQSGWLDNYVAQHTPQQTKAILESYGYECYGDYFIAYKGIKANRYPKFNFSRQYNVGETYEDACYVGPGLYGPGICVSTIQEAGRYCDELIIKCEVRYEDVGAVLKDGLFMRCFKIKVLSDMPRPV